jgi:3-oxoacyl-[acyl-carrier protein] reductase
MTAIKRAIVCGSTDGIGKAIALSLCKEGYAITLIARDLNKLEIVKSELDKINSNNHFFIQLDFNQPESIKPSLAAVENWQATEFMLINNVGGPMPQNILECEIQDFQSVFNKYLLSFSELSKFFSSKMKKANWGRIVNILGTTILEPIPGLSLSVVKSATSNWAKALSIELGKFNITVNNVLPGPTNTKELDEIIEIVSKQAGITREQLINDTLTRIPLRRIAEPTEIADGVTFLCSDKAAFITGSNIKIDGGYSTCL